MKLDEVKKLIATYSKEESDYVILQLYKLIPKNKREEYDTDDLLQNPKAHITGKKPVQKKESSVSLEGIEAEHRFFLENAYAQNYLIPNRYVSKKDRPKWRFVVMRLYKETLWKSGDEDSLARCAELLEKLYLMLTYSCGYILFSAYDTFESIKISQSEFFRSVIDLYNKCYDKPKYIEKSIDLITDNHLNRYTLHSELIWIFADTLNIPDLKYTAIDQALYKWTVTQASLAGERSKKKTFGSDNKEYQIQEKCNHLIEIAFTCYCLLFEFENAINLFHEKYLEKDKEIALYILVRFLMSVQQPELIDEQITLAEKRGISPRKRLLEVRDFIKKHNKTPDYL